MRGEERREGGAHRAATKSLRQLRSAEVAGDDGGHRRQRRKGAARSAPRSGSRLALTDGDWVDDGGGDDGLDGEANGARWPRGQSRRGGEHARVRERGKLEGESGGEWERRGVEALPTRGFAGAVVGRRRAPVAARTRGTGRGGALRGAGPARLVRWVGLLGWAEAQGEARGSPTPSSFLFFFFKQLLHFLFF